jgi:hypothetical protein
MMATINYNGMELEEFTTPQIFDPPKTMVVWEDDKKPTTAVVIALLAKSSNFQYRVVINDCSFYPHCALLPDPPKPRRATNRELARWLAQGNGEYTNPKSDYYNNYSSFSYKECDKDNEIYANFKVRRWEDTEWHEPTVDYIRLEDVK